MMMTKARHEWSLHNFSLAHGTLFYNLTRSKRSTIIQSLSHLHKIGKLTTPTGALISIPQNWTTDHLQDTTIDHSITYSLQINAKNFSQKLTEYLLLRTIDYLSGHDIITLNSGDRQNSGFVNPFELLQFLDGLGVFSLFIGDPFGYSSSKKISPRSSN